MHLGTLISKKKKSVNLQVLDLKKNLNGAFSPQNVNVSDLMSQYNNLSCKISTI